MTGGQMAPTTMLGQITATTPAGTTGRRPGLSAAMSPNFWPSCPAQFTSSDADFAAPPIFARPKAALKHAFELQMNNAKGLSLVELAFALPDLLANDTARCYALYSKRNDKGLPPRPIKGLINGKQTVYMKKLQSPGSADRGLSSSANSSRRPR